MKGLLAALAVMAICGTPLASARAFDLPSGTQTIEATGPGGADYSYDEAGNTCDHPSGSLFPLGDTTVDCGAGGSFVVSVLDRTAPTVSAPGDQSAHTTSASGTAVSYPAASATDTVDGSLTANCSPGSGSNFAVGTTTVTCSATDAHGNAGSASFSVTVTLDDTTPPVISNVPSDISVVTGSSGGAAVSYSTPTANDDIDGSVPVSCNPPSGATFAVGDTHVDCTATDAHGNNASAGFNVHVTLDNVPPTFSGVPGSITQDTESAGGASVSYTPPTATDNLDGSRPVTCSPGPGVLFPVGTTTVHCTASDTHGNDASADFSVTINLVDHTAPTFNNVPGTISKNTETPGGAAVTYTAPTASDNLDGSLPVSCAPPSGSTFVVGTTTVTCSATDAHGNRATTSFNVVVTLVDNTAPVLSNLPANISVEANSPSGAQATFASPTAVDNLAGPIPFVGCSPSSGSTFPLGSTTVTCTATDAHGNAGTAGFTVSVVDTTPPTINPPGKTTVYATTDAGVPAADQGPVSRFVLGSHVSDVADPSPRVFADAPQFFTVGTTTVTFTAIDASGNRAAATSTLTVLPKPAPGTTPPPLPPPVENTPPANVRNAAATAGDRRVVLRWAKPSDRDFDHTEITRTTSAASFKVAGTLVYKGTATSYVDKSLKNGTAYRYLIQSVDKNGNMAAGVAVVVTPRASLLKTPKAGIKLKKAPKLFTWAVDSRANYYNFQLYRGNTLLFTGAGAAPKKILSVWPVKPRFAFKSPWKFEGKKYKLAKGVYTWYVWPGYGPRSEVKYGQMLGSATFQMTK